jgi:hypothetical protein
LATLVEGPVTRAAQDTEAGQQDDEQGEDGRIVSEHCLMNRKPPCKRREGGKRLETRSKNVRRSNALAGNTNQKSRWVQLFLKSF